MKRSIYIFIIIITYFSSYGQHELKDTWKGVLVRAGNPIEKGSVFYLNIENNSNPISGRTREELFDTDKFSVNKVKGEIAGNKMNFSQFVTEKSSKSAKSKWCKFNAQLTYDSITGYLTGDYQSTDCKRVIGKIILFKSDFTLSTSEEQEVSHIWFTNFIKDYNAGLNAPIIREIERDNFQFEPIFFDFDKSIIRAEHHDFLYRLIKVVKGHSDLRVKVVGHTDSDGSNNYNDVLSKRRAEAIIAFFVANGLSADRLEFDFKGETQPIDTNGTAEGKQRNRRVDFSFI